MPTNLLTAEQEGFEGGTTTGWLESIDHLGNPHGPPDNSADISSVTTYALDGLRSMRVLNTSGLGNRYLQCRTPVGASGVPVTGGASYVASAWFRQGTNQTTTQIAVDWYDSAGGFISESFAQGSNDVAFTQLSLTAQAPANAAYASVSIVHPLAYGSDSHYVDRVEFYELSEPEPARVKVWNGTAWVERPTKVWNGTAWVERPVVVL